MDSKKCIVSVDTLIKALTNENKRLNTIIDRFLSACGENKDTQSSEDFEYIYEKINQIFYEYNELEAYNKELSKKCDKKMEFLRKLARRCIELNKQNTKLKQALKDAIYETCSYSDDCDNCEIGILGQCKIPQAYEALEKIKTAFKERGLCDYDDEYEYDCTDCDVSVNCPYYIATQALAPQECDVEQCDFWQQGETNEGLFDFCTGYCDDCNNCEIGILGQCKIPQAYEVLQELELNKAPF